MSPDFNPAVSRSCHKIFPCSSLLCLGKEIAITVLSVAREMEVFGEVQFESQLGGFSSRLGYRGPGLAKRSEFSRRRHRPNRIFDGWVTSKNDRRSVQFNRAPHNS